jgi:hypothetical protein
MTGDFSRKTFDPAKDFSLVRMQQGRLFTDADWNEQGDILRSSDRETAIDVIGHSGFPEGDAGFGLIFDVAADTLILTPGTGYVAGVRHVTGAPQEFSVVKLSGNGADATWGIVDGPALSDGDVLTADTTGLSGFVKVTNFAQAQDGTRTFRTTPALAPADVKLVKPILANRQPYAPHDVLPTTAGNYIVYLKSTELPVTALDDPLIREVAFDGPDTAIRDRTIWQVGMASLPDLLAFGYTLAELTCPALAGGFDPVLAGRAPGLMRARAEVSALSAGPCTLPPAAGYRSLENLLYRVEIHTGGAAALARYKWSRENAIHRTRYREMDAGVLIVDSVGRDELTALKVGDWIEIRDQDDIFVESPGFFARIDEVVGKRISLAELLDPVTLLPLTAAGQPDTAKLPPTAFVTRWEGGAPNPVTDAVGDWVTLENGVQVRFVDGVFQSSDHWTIPARAVTGDIEWPRDPITSEPVLKAPEGPRRDYTALALAELSGDGSWTVTEDCRLLFPPITRAKQFLYAGGDGQEAMPDPLAPATRVLLPKSLAAAVVRGHSPVQGESIRFEIVEGDGRLGNGQKTQIATTGADGLATVTWALDATTFSQSVVATRLDAAGNPTHTTIVYNATLARADQTSYDPANTPELAGANTVQEAIEVLVGMQQIGCTTYIIREGEDWVTVLESLKPGENASICFARGTYTTSRTVRLDGLGHIRISGAGPTIAKIVANRVEAALSITNCVSISISNLEITSPDGSSGIPLGDTKGRQGTVDISHCPSVDIHGCLLHCGAGTSPGRTCLTVRGWTEELGTLRVTSRLHVHENTFSVGHMQEALLITDATDICVAHNHFAVKPRKAQSLGIDVFLKDKAWISRTVGSFITRPVKGNVATKGMFKEIRGREWRISFQSPISQKSWDAFVAKNPPNDTDLKSAAAFEDYANRLIATAAEDPTQVEEFVKQLDRLKVSFGADARKLDDPRVRKALMVTSNPSVYRFDAKEGAIRDVLIEARGQVVSFNSPFSQEDWNRAIARSKEAPNIANADELLGLSYKLGEMLLLDKEFRRGMGSVSNWFKAFTDDSPSLAMHAIVCGGRTLGNVQIHDNIIREFQVGIRVAPSHQRLGVLSARSVSIDNNRMELLLPNNEAYGGYGIFVGNVQTLRIRGNDMALSSKPNFKRFFAQGIRIWGDLGYQVLVADNRIAIATMGIRLNDIKGNKDNPRLWVLRENLIEGPQGTRDFKVSPFGVEIDQHNLTVQV